MGVGGASDDGAAAGPTAGADSGSTEAGIVAGVAGVMGGKAVAAGAVWGMGCVAAPENLLLVLEL